MGKALYENFALAREIFDAADGVLKGIKDAIFGGSREDLKRTEIAQPAIFIASCAAYKVF